MKLQVAFDLVDLDEALRIAALVESHVDILEVGSLLIYKYGDTAIRQFRQTFPQKTILADIKIADRAKEAVTLCAQAGAHWITVLAGTEASVIRVASATAHELGKKIMLDLIDASSLGQSALEARDLGADALLFHKPADTEQSGTTLLEYWDMVRGNTDLPIFISASITRDIVHSIIEIQPSALVIGKAIVEADNPGQEAAYYRSLLTK